MQPTYHILTPEETIAKLNDRPQLRTRIAKDCMMIFLKDPEKVYPGTGCVAEDASVEKLFEDAFYSIVQNYIEDKSWPPTFSPSWVHTLHLDNHNFFSRPEEREQWKKISKAVHHYFFEGGHLFSLETWRGDERAGLELIESFPEKIRMDLAPQRIALLRAAKPKALVWNTELAPKESLEIQDRAL